MNPYVAIDLTARAISQRSYPDGVTVTVFAPPGSGASWQMTVLEFQNLGGTFSNGVEFEPGRQSTTVAGAPGTAAWVTRAAIDELNEGIAPGSPSYYEHVYEVDLCNDTTSTCNYGPIDAVALCAGQGAVPTE